MSGQVREIIVMSTDWWARLLDTEIRRAGGDLPVEYLLQGIPLRLPAESMQIPLVLHLPLSCDKLSD